MSLQCHYSKIFKSIILERIRKKTAEILSEEQAGLRASRSTINQLFTLRQLSEKYTDFSRDLFVCYIDFRKAFDSIWRKGLWRVMRNMGYPEKIVRLLEGLYSGTFSAVRIGADLTEWFETIVGVLQGCMLSPLLFNIFLEIIMARALTDVDAGAVINGHVISNLRFADDIAALAEKEKELQQVVDNIVAESKKMGMMVNIEKTEVQQIDDFIYLGGTISDDASTDKDVQRRTGLACGVMQSLAPIWRSKAISTQTKVKVYETLVLSVLLYNSETWALKESTKKKLRVFEMSCLRKIKGVTRRNRVRNTEIRRELKVETDVVEIIQRRRLRYFGHITRMSGERLPAIAFSGNVHGLRKRGRPKKRWEDNLKADLDEMGHTMVEAIRLASSDRDVWRKSVLGLSERGSPSPRH